MGRRNHPKRRPQAQRRKDGSAGGRKPPPPPLEHAIVPHGRCHYPHRKLQFTEAEVSKALRQAQATRRAHGQQYTEQRYYECKATQGGCGFWHLTSRTNYQPRRTA